MSLTQRSEAMSFITEMSKETNTKIIAGINVLLTPPSLMRINQGYTLTIDPSRLSDDDEVRIESYAKTKGLTVEEQWNDWGRFIKLYKA